MFNTRLMVLNHQFTNQSLLEHIQKQSLLKKQKFYSLCSIWNNIKCNGIKKLVIEGQYIRTIFSPNLITHSCINPLWRDL